MERYGSEALVRAEGRIRAYELQFAELREWCLERYGVDTNSVIGKPGWPFTLVEVVTQAVESREVYALMIRWADSRFYRNVNAARPWADGDFG